MPRALAFDVCGRGPCSSRITVELRRHNLLVDTGETVTQTQHLVFRPSERIEAELHDAGFEPEAVPATGRGTPFGGDEPIMVFVARAR
ncbi:MAG: hypothetical protein Q4E05_02245 [Pseudoclavibacter sp.]|nr:hypothetical protein [Pseudoclavibacter sp.]